MAHDARSHAKRLARMGRGNDKHLLHVTSRELDALSRSGMLTKNPKTGLPEAGFFSDFFDSVGDLAGSVVNNVTSFIENPDPATLLSYGADFLAPGSGQAFRTARSISRGENPLAAVARSYGPGFLNEAGSFGDVGPGSFDSGGVGDFGGDYGGVPGGAGDYGPGSFDSGFDMGDAGGGGGMRFGSDIYAPGMEGSDIGGGGFPWEGGSPSAGMVFASDPFVDGGYTGGGPASWMDSIKSLPWKDIGRGVDTGTGLYGLLQARRMQKLAQMRAQAMDPFAAQRAQFAQQLQALMANPASIENTPGWQAGSLALQRAGAAQGLTGSGQMAASLQKYGGDFYNNTVNQLAGLAGANINPAAASDMAMQGSVNSTNLIGQSLGRIARGVSGFGGR